MKKLLILLCLTISITFSASATNRALPRSFTPFSQEILKTGFWDLTRLGVNDENSHAWVYEKNSQYVEVLPERELLYYMKTDSLFFRAYTEGRIEGLLNENMSLSRLKNFPSPFHINDSLHMSGLRGDIRVRTEGSIEAYSMKTGTFVFAAGDTLRDVRLECERHVLTEYFPENSSEGFIYTITLYRWFHKTDLLPLAVQYSIEAPDNKFENLYSVKHECTDNSEAEYSGSAWGDGPEVTLSNRTLTISFADATEQPVSLTVCLLDVSGLSRFESMHVISDSVTEIPLPTDGLPRGYYMLVIRPEIPDAKIIKLNVEL